MPKTMSASEAHTKFGSVMKWAIESGDEVIVESHGKPKVVILPFEEYE
ncbi:MAG: type II toxin-antitoxin system Phd/YefM family antitoxin, partial [Ardenticatenaceae bacterium]